MTSAGKPAGADANRQATLWVGPNRGRQAKESVGSRLPPSISTQPVPRGN
jgi:hypothetical protein